VDQMVGAVGGRHSRYEIRPTFVEGDSILKATWVWFSSPSGLPGMVE
jgi:hypothetical protein